MKRLNVLLVGVPAVCLPALFGGPIHAQVTEAWVARYDGPGNDDDVACALAVDASGNVCVTGYSCGSGTSSDYATIKYDPDGNELWVARYNGPGNGEDQAYALAVDVAGNIYVAGKSGGGGTGDDYATIKYDPSGNQLWAVRYNGPGNGADVTRSIGVDDAGNVYVTGSSFGIGTQDDDYATIKYDPSGNQLWVARYNGPGSWFSDEASALAVDAFGNVYVTGSSSGFGSYYYDYATVKYAATGSQVWVSRYNGPGNYGDWAADLAVDLVGNIYVTGESYGSGTSYDYATIKYDPSGNQLWVARYNGPGNWIDSGSALAVDASGSVYVTGTSLTGGSGDYATIKYDTNGNQLWAARYDGQRGNWDNAAALGLDVFGNVYVTGKSYGGLPSHDDYATIKYDANGNQLWVVRYTGPGDNRDGATGLGLDFSGNVHVTGSSDQSWLSPDYATIKYVQPRTWTVMVYCCADNSLDPNGVEDLNEMEWAGSGDSVNMIFLLDRDNSQTQLTEDTHLYYVIHDPNGLPGGEDGNIVSVPIDEYARSWLAPEEDMGNPQTLIDFGVWTVEHYPADHYCLVVWDHGNGIFIKEGSPPAPLGECWDDHGGVPGDYIDLAELRDVLDSISTAAGKKIDIVHHDACWMGQMETHYQLTQYADIGVASEELIPGDGGEYGYPYKDLVDNPLMTASELATEIVDYFYTRYGANADLNTLAAVDLTALATAVVPMVNDFSCQLTRDVWNYGGAITTARGTAENYNDDYWAPDLYHFAQLIQGDPLLPQDLRNSAQDLMSSYPQAIIDEKHGNNQPNAHGMTIWFPEDFFTNPHHDDYMTKIDFHDEYWDEFLAMYDEPAPAVTIDLVPRSTTVPRGGTLIYDRTLVNHTFCEQTVQFWSTVTFPNGSTRRAIAPVLIPLAANETRTDAITHPVPNNAPLGKYTYTGKIGTYPTPVMSEDSFTFRVVRQDGRR